MSMTKRMQGRPPRNSGMNGRDKLIEATRIYLQSNRKLSLTRTEIAQGCGVTPALISYYFKDKRSLLDAVTKPLLRTYKTRLAAISSSPATASAKMFQVIRLLIDLNIKDAFLVEHVSRPDSYDVLDAEDRAAVESFRTAIAGLAHDLVRQGDWRDTDPHLVEIALWGLCRAFGETFAPSTAQEPDPTETGMAVETQVIFIYGMFQAPAETKGHAAFQGGHVHSELVQQ